MNGWLSFISTKEVMLSISLYVSPRFGLRPQSLKGVGVWVWREGEGRGWRRVVLLHPSLFPPSVILRLRGNLEISAKPLVSQLKRSLRFRSVSLASPVGGVRWNSNFDY